MNLFSRMVLQWQIASHFCPCVHGPFRSLQGCFDNHVFWKVRFHGKSFEKSLIQASCVFFLGNGQGHFVIVYMGDRRNEVISRREMGCAGRVPRSG